MKKVTIPTMVKDNKKIKDRRHKIIEASKKLFKEKGYYRTTTREIARSASMSYGAIYEYIGTKEDILYLFFEELYDRLNEILHQKLSHNRTGKERLEIFIQEYFSLMDHISDEVNVMYKETGTLSKPHLEYVFSKETEFVEYVKETVLLSLKEAGNTVADEMADICVHNLIVQGHMWAFRGWHLKKKYSLATYTKLQTEICMKCLDL